jgi:outer membrane protein OmpA-like peptidoglycan-associated protein
MRPRLPPRRCLRSLQPRPPTRPARKETASGPAAGEKEQASVDNEADSHANDKAKAELASLQPGLVPKDLVAALSDSVINFASDSAEVPASTRKFLQKAADDLKQLPTGHVVEIAGYTDNNGDEALNVALSQRRADAVRDAFIKFGVAPDMLVAKGSCLRFPGDCGRSESALSGSSNNRRPPASDRPEWAIMPMYKAELGGQNRRYMSTCQL